MLVSPLGSIDNALGSLNQGIYVAHGALSTISGYGNSWSTLDPTGLQPLVDLVLSKPQQSVKLQTRDLALCRPGVERGGFHVQLLSQFLDRE